MRIVDTAHEHDLRPRSLLKCPSEIDKAFQRPAESELTMEAVQYLQKVTSSPAETVGEMTSNAMASTLTSGRENREPFVIGEIPPSQNSLTPLIISPRLETELSSSLALNITKVA